MLAVLVGGCFDGGEQTSRTTGVSATTATSTTTTTGDETTTSTSTTTTTTATTTTTTGALGDADAFRITKLAVVDPHFYYQLSMGAECNDVTNLVNFGIDSELSGGDVSHVLVFFPADPDAESTPLLISGASCNGALDTCSVANGEASTMTTAENAAAGVCSLLVSGTVNPIYSGAGSPNIPNAPCFASVGGEGSIRIADTLPEMTLQDVRVAATYAGGDAVSTLIEGTLRGYLTESAGLAVDGSVSDFPFNLWNAVSGGGSCQVDEMNPIDDTDPNPDPRSAEKGVWIYLNFEAARVEWLE
ncbi:MAG: hypothetical protein KC486_24950 [Myxococcales bacterium]|nr:hypothetical protein [Myxococcales bacterium]